MAIIAKIGYQQILLAEDADMTALCRAFQGGVALSSGYVSGFGTYYLREYTTPEISFSVVDDGQVVNEKPEEKEK